VTEERLLGDRYQLEERIAVGGMGEVWRAHDNVLGRSVAVKLLKSEYMSDPAFLERFRAEARHTAGLSHPGIASVYDYGESGEVAYLVMELVDGEPLSGLIARDGPLSAERTLDIVAQTAFALQAAHEAGVVHRDVKPGNLLVRRDGVVKVTDFGIARAVDAAPLTRTGVLVGTAHYVSPEQVSGKSAGPASDVYSLGVVAYECLTGRRPFDGDGPVAVALAHQRNDPPPMPESVPGPVRSLVEQTMAKDPGRRPGSAGDLGRTALAVRELLSEPGPLPALDVAPPAATRAEGATRVTQVLPMTSPTIERPAVGPAAATAAAPTELRTNVTTVKSESAQRHTRNRLLVLGLCVVVVGGLLLRACAATATVHVPKVTGEPDTKAALALQVDHLTQQLKFIPDPFAPRGWVLRQSPNPGTKVAENTTVVLTVASGKQLITLNRADYVGKPYSQDYTRLRALDFLVTEILSPSPQKPGTVINMMPVGPQRQGATVTLYVASQPPPVHDHGGGKKGGPPGPGGGPPGNGDGG
jgi:hypothetical protein